MMNKRLKTVLLILQASAIIIGGFIIWGLLLMDAEDREVLIHACGVEIIA